MPVMHRHTLTSAGVYCRILNSRRQYTRSNDVLLFRSISKYHW